MLSSLNEPAAQLVIGFALLCIFSAIAFYVLTKIRPKSIQQDQKTEELLTKFREMRARGELSEAEYRTIKTTVADRIQREVKQEGEKRQEA